MGWNLKSCCFALAAALTAGALHAAPQETDLSAFEQAVLPGRVGVVFDDLSVARRFGFDSTGHVVGLVLDDRAEDALNRRVDLPGHLVDGNLLASTIRVAKWLNGLEGVRLAEPDMAHSPQEDILSADLLVRFAQSDELTNNVARMATRSPIPDSKGMGVNDPGATEQWAANQIRSELSWTQTVGDGAIVVVLDSGFHPHRPDVGSYDLANSWSFIFNRAIPTGEEVAGLDHGLAVSSVVMTLTNNQQGLASVVPGASVLPFDIAEVSRTAGSYGATASTVSVAQAIYHVNGAPRSDGAVLPADVRERIAAINYSYAGSYEVISHLILDAAKNSSVAVVKAAENRPYYQYGLKRLPVERPDGLVALSSWEEDVLVVGGTASDGIYYSLSPKGSLIDLYAPAELVPLLDAEESSGWRATSGNSFAAPHVAAVLAAMKSVWPAMSKDDALRAMRTGGMSVDLGAPGHDELYAYGLLDQARAVQTALREGQGVEWTIPDYEDDAYGQVLITSDGFRPGLSRELEDAGLLSRDRPAERAVLEAFDELERLYYAADEGGGEMGAVVDEGLRYGGSAAEGIF